MMGIGGAGFGRHGGRRDEARLAFPHAPAPWIDLSTGINPVPWIPRAEIPVDPGPLPGIAALVQLEATVATYLGVRPERVAAVPGSEIALRLLPALALPAPLVALGPGYGTHTAVAEEQVTVSALECGTGRPGTILLANPNNPDGRVLAPATLRDIAERQRAVGGWLVIDEAFTDPAPEISVLPHLSDDAPVLVLRSFGKFFGLAGVRLGFAVGPPVMIERLRALLGDWPVATQAIAWGTAAYADDGWIAAARRGLTERSARLDATLARHQLTATGASPLFRLVTRADASALFERLARAGILTRPFADRPDWLRFGLPGDERAFERLDGALRGG